MGPGTTSPGRARPARNTRDELNNFGNRKVTTIMEKIRTGPVPMLLVGAVSCLAMACASSAPRVTSRAGAATRTEFPAHLVARSISVSGPEDAGPLEIYVERW